MRRSILAKSSIVIVGAIASPPGSGKAIGSAAARPRRGRRLEQRVELLRIDALHQVLVRRDPARQRAGVGPDEVATDGRRARVRRAGPAPAAPARAGPTAAGSRRGRASRRPAARALRAGVLGEQPGLRCVEGGVDAVGDGHDRRAAPCRIRARRSCSAIGTALASARRRRRRPCRRRAASLPSKRLLMKSAARLAMFTYLPTRSLLTRATKSSGLNSMSSTCAFSLAAM